MKTYSNPSPAIPVQGRIGGHDIFRHLRILMLSLSLIFAGLAPSARAFAQDECQEANGLMSFDYRSYGIGRHRTCEFYDLICLALKAKEIVLGEPVAAWILLSREAALAAGVSPIPPQIRKDLSHLYSAALMDKVRYKTGSGFLGTLQWFREEMGNRGAITLKDVIVFSNAKGANNPELWAHELEHVRQYEQLGVDGFAQAYVHQTCILPGDTFLGGYDSRNCQLERQADRKARYYNQSGFITCCSLRNAPATLVLRDRVLNGQEVFVARDSITIGPNVILGAKGDVSLRAGRLITFSPEFRSDTGGKLLAKIDPALSKTCSR